MYPPSCCPILTPRSTRGVKRLREELGPIGRYGGAPLAVAVKKNIVHLYYDLLLTPEEIAPLILSPRKPRAAWAFEPSKMCLTSLKFITTSRTLSEHRAR